MNPENAMDHDRYPDSYIRGILNTYKVFAMVGASPNQVRPSFFVQKYLLAKGYKVIPVNPGHAGKEILGQTVYASLRDIPEPVDVVDIFRNSVLCAGDHPGRDRHRRQGGMDAAWRAQ